MKSNSISRFLNEDQKVTVWPKKHADKDLVLAYLITKFEIDKTYHENEVNEILKQWHTFQDWPLLRRELFERSYITRNIDGTAYKRTQN